MNKTSIDELLKKVDSRYMLVSIISKRARQIVEGDPPKVDTDTINPVNISTEEFSEDKINYTE
jgi:DNA-directed RNA polymerase subunit omega